MKKIILSLLICFPVVLFAQNIGIGTTNPLARLHVTDSNVIFSAPYADGSLPLNLPINGAGTRIMWLPAIGAFRVGSVSGNNWNKDSIGIYSFASGIDTRALGLASTAMGQGSLAYDTWATAIGLNDTAAAFETVSIGTNSKAAGFSAIALGGRAVAIGDYSSALGHFNSATGTYSTAIGAFSNANADNSTSIGNLTTANGIRSTALGNATTAGGDFSTAIGNGTTASGAQSTSMGYITTASGIGATGTGWLSKASGDISTTMGLSTTARSFLSVSLGRYNDSIVGSNQTSWVTTDPLLIIGNGTSNAVRSNALVVYKNSDADLNGYTRLGAITDGSPRIKIKKITATGPATNGSVAIVHNLTAAKILSVSISMEYGLGQAETVPAFYTISNGFEYQYQVRTSDILISNKNGNSANIASMPVKILITYEE